MSEKETIMYKGKNYTRYPESPKKHLREYYWHHGKWKEPPVSLHVQIWKDTYGDIPNGYVIHHIDGNPDNNNIDNLECVSQKEHMAKHYSDKEWSGAIRIALSEGQLRRPMLKYVCKNCNKEFESRRSHNVLFCSDKCGQQWRTKNGTSKSSYEKVCKKCQKRFKTTKWHRKLCYDCYKERSDVSYSGKK